MKITLVLLSVVGFCVLRVAANANKCDPKLIAAIDKHWGSNVPSNIIQSSIANGKEVVVGSTDDYFPDDTKCVYAYFHPDGFMFNVIPNKGELKVLLAPREQKNHLESRTLAANLSQFTCKFQLAAVTTDVNLEEDDGTLTNQDTSVLRYQIYSKGGVMAFHKCLPNGGPEGIPKAIIKVRASNYKKENVDEAKALLKEMGIEITKEYPSDCQLKL